MQIQDPDSEYSTMTFSETLELYYETREDYDDREEYRETFYERLASRYGLL